MSPIYKKTCMKIIPPLLGAISLFFFSCQSGSQTPKEEASNAISVKEKIPVFVFTDINIGKGDPDDRQSWVHLLWYADELDIRGFVPDRWAAQGWEATMEGIAEYEKDYEAWEFGQKGYPDPASIRKRVAPNDTAAVDMLYREAMEASEPLYVLIWGNMKNFKKALFAHPEIADRIRVLTIGTGVKYGPKDEVPGEACDVPNWNGPGRNEIYADARFDSMWWLENNWTYNGMFSGNRPEEMFDTLSTFGSMGAYIKTVVKEHPWAQYFRVGDTPSVLYLIDSDHDLNDPTQPSWAGTFAHPFPTQRPHYYTDDSGPIEWDYVDPCKTWGNREAMYAYNKGTLEAQREEMYTALLEKLTGLYR